MAADDDDVTINHVALHSAAVQSTALALFSGFLGGASEGDGNEADAYSPPDKIEDGLFRDIDGLGYKGSKGGATDPQSRGGSAATEALRKQMLGKRATKPNVANKSGGLGARTGNTSHAAKARPKHARKAESSDDEETGRSKLGTRNKSSAALAVKDPEPLQNEKGQMQIPSVSALPSGKSCKRGSSYLDQILEERAARKKKSKKTTED